MKKIIIILLSLVISISLFAQEQKKRVNDEAGLLTAAEIAGFEKRAQEIANKYNFDLAILTKTTLDGANLETFADNYFDSDDGCLFLLVMDQRDYHFNTAGKGIKLLDNNTFAFERLEKTAVNYIKANNYTAAYQAFFNLMEEILTLEAKGRSYNFFHVYHIHSLIVAWLIAIACGFYCLNYWKSQMNTVIPAKEADNYIASANLAVSGTKDRFLFSTVTKIPRVDKTALAKGAIRMASSGRRHGGRSGKF